MQYFLFFVLIPAITGASAAGAVIIIAGGVKRK